MVTCNDPYIFYCKIFFTVETLHTSGDLCGYSWWLVGELYVAQTEIWSTWNLLNKFWSLIGYRIVSGCPLKSSLFL